MSNSGLACCQATLGRLDRPLNTGDGGERSENLSAAIGASGNSDGMSNSLNHLG